MNICGITGRLTDDVVMRTTTSNKSVVAFALAVQRPKSKDKTDFVDCVAWEKTAEFISKYGCKGKKLEISGCITTRTYEHNGKKQKKTEILVDDVKFAESKKNAVLAIETILSDGIDKAMNLYNTKKENKKKK